MDKREIGYGLAGFGSVLLAYYLYTKSHTKSTVSANTSTIKSQAATPSQTSTTIQQSTLSSCELITPNNFSQQLLAQCFGGSLTACGLYQPLITINGFCEALTPSTNYSVKMPNINSGLVFNNQTDGFFGLYWAYPGVFGGVSPCYCNNTTMEFPANNTGAFFSFLGLIMPNGYTWLPTYEFPSSGLGFLTYKGALWYSPSLTYVSLSYIKNNNLVYTVSLQNTPDDLGYSVQTYTTPQNTGGSLCFDYVDLNSNFCITVAPNQTIPFWANSSTRVLWCPANNAPNCQTVY